MPRLAAAAASAWRTSDTLRLCLLASSSGLSALPELDVTVDVARNAGVPIAVVVLR